MYEHFDPEIGRILIKINQRAKSVIARRKADCVALTVPSFFTKKDILRAIEQLKPRLLSVEPKPVALIDENTTFETFSFRVVVQRYALSDTIRMSLKNGMLSIFVPQQIDITRPNVQDAIKELIRQGLRFEAKRILPQKTALFASKNKLQFSEVKINKSLSRWGSCSRKKSLNFSLYLLLLPEKLIDYVVLHELTHTVEMNHSDRFWSLLDTFCGEDSKALSRLARNFRSEGYDLLKP
ncbi:MAG: M48 family metallopeptidase [Dysgonamonadaceae bacterium]|jgi:predicted metal-dependent hydrolase|nr:M48 family metallopeptidase [Dysgonamonadaceae bacterium]